MKLIMRTSHVYAILGLPKQSSLHKPSKKSYNIKYDKQEQKHFLIIIIY